MFAGRSCPVRPGVRALCATLLMAGCLVSPRTTLADPAPDPGHIFTLQVENDATAGTDRYYTSGIRLGLTLPTGQVPDALANLGHALLGDGQQRISLGISQLLFTPRLTQVIPPPANDRPYAGLLLGRLALVQDTDTTRTTLAAEAGVIGPNALGRQLQNGFHSFIGQHGNVGWGSQLPNQPVLQLLASRIWRVPVASLGPVEADILPTVSAGVGLWRDYALAGGEVRLGQGLASDFGVPRIEPALDGEDAYRPARPFAWYVFAGADGQAVAFDETISGEPFRNTAHVSLIPLVGEMQFGIAVMVFGVRATFADVLRTHEYRGQFGGLFQFGSASVSFRF